VHKKKTNISETATKIKFLINYDAKKTLNENLILVNEQWMSKTEELGLSPEQRDKSAKESEKNTEYYYEDCSSPDKAIEPPQTMAGNQGMIPGFCYYPVASMGKDNVGKVGGIFLPSDAEITFWDDIKTYNDALETTFKQNQWKKAGATFDGVITNFTETFPMGTVYKFKWGQSTYLPSIRYSPNEVSNGIFEVFYFIGFYNQDNLPYNPPVIGDDRNDYQKFIDDWGSYIQWTSVLATAIVGLFTGGSTLPLTAELLIELGIGVAVGMREIEKGNDVAGVFSIITGLLPSLKAIPSFRGIDPKWANSLSVKFAESGLNSSSKLSKYVSFYNKLTKPEKEIMAKMFRSGDDYTKRAILKGLSNELKQQIPNLLQKGFIKMWKQKPKLFKSIPFFERLWVRELGANAAVGVAGYLVDYKYPELNSAERDKLSEEMKDKLDGVYYVIPEDTQKLLSLNLLGNPDQAELILKDPELAKSIEFGKNYVGEKGDNISKGLISFFQKAVTDSVEKNGGESIVIKEEWFQSDKMNEKQLSDLKNQGYVEKDSVPFGTKFSDIKFINDIYWIKPVNPGEKPIEK
jgi:hypothetical protein